MYRRELGIGYLPQEMSIFRTSVGRQYPRDPELPNLTAPRRRERLEELLSVSDRTFAPLFPRDGLLPVGVVNGRRGRNRAPSVKIQNMRCWMKPLLLALDPIAVGEIRHLTADLKHGIGVLITDHNVQETLQIVIGPTSHDGKILMSGTTDERSCATRMRRVYREFPSAFRDL
jgi:lipopolysaccharide export system ATP-binding protein